MSCSYPVQINILKSNNTLRAKRSVCDLNKCDDPEWPVCKRPRRIGTPSSAISAVTEESDASPVDTDVIDNYQLDSPTYSVGLSSPAHGFESQNEPYNHTSSPCRSPSPPPSDTYSLRSEDEIVADVDNSFATGQTGAIAWTNEMLIQVLANDIEDLCYTNEEGGAPGISDEYHNFFSQYKQPFELDFYIRRLVQYSNCSTAAFVIMLVYLDRVQERCKDLLVTEMNCHRLLCTALVLAVKYLDDEVFSNSYYARVGGVTCEEMNDLEVKMLNVLGWNLSVSPETYALYEDGLIQSAGMLADQQLPGSPASTA